MNSIPQAVSESGMKEGISNRSRAAQTAGIDFFSGRSAFTQEPPYLASVVELSRQDYYQSGRDLDSSSNVTKERVESVLFVDFNLRNVLVIFLAILILYAFVNGVALCILVLCCGKERGDRPEGSPWNENFILRERRENAYHVAPWEVRDEEASLWDAEENRLEVPILGTVEVHIPEEALNKRILYVLPAIRETPESNEQVAAPKGGDVVTTKRLERANKRITAVESVDNNL